MSEFDRTKWQKRYGTGDRDERAPHPFLDAVAAAHLPAAGTALDLAGGRGRNARWLARRGLDVTLLDISAAGLATAVAHAAEEGLSLTPLERDLEAHGLPDGQWDVVLVSYFLVRDVLGGLAERVAPGGRLVLVHPTRANLERHARPPARWLFEDGEFTGVPGLETLHLEEGWGSTDQHEVRYVGGRPV